MRSLLAACLFVFFLIESTIMPWLLPQGASNFIAPHFVLVGIIYVGLFLNRHRALFLGLLFGLLMDITHFVYLFGLYTFLFGITGYMVGLVSKRYALHFAPTITAVATCLFIYEISVYVIYSFYDQMTISFFAALIRNMIPSVIVNTAFAALIFVPAEKLLLIMQTYEHDEK
jgi:rod shape-determining protein MreD